MTTLEEVTKIATDNGLHFRPNEPHTQAQLEEVKAVLLKEARIKELRRQGVEYHKAFAMVRNGDA